MRKKKLKNKQKTALISPKYIGYTLLFIALSVGFVYSRMRGVELQYQVNKLVKKIQKNQQHNKHLKAQKADLLSSGNLKKIAQKYKLKEPSRKQIIVIPNE